MIRLGCLAVFLVLAASGAMAETRAVTIDNQTDGVVRGVYATEVGDDNWHLDYLQDNIQPGDKVVIKLPTARCAYDFRVLLDLRPDELLLMNVDVCKKPVIVVDATRGRLIRRQAK